MVIAAFLAMTFMSGILDVVSYYVWGFQVGGRALQLADAPMLFLTSIGNMDTCLVMASMFIYWALILAALMLFQQTMRRYKVRPSHVFRVLAHAVPMIWPVVCVTVLVGILFGLVVDPVRSYACWLSAGADTITPTMPTGHF